MGSGNTGRGEGRVGQEQRRQGTGEARDRKGQRSHASRLLRCAARTEQGRNAAIASYLLLNLVVCGRIIVTCW